MKVKELPLSAIRIDGGTQPRDELDLAAVADYALAMKAGDRFPASKAVFDGKDHWLYGGFHRYHATKAAEIETLWCEVEEGTLDDARWLALGENVEHDLAGVRRTNKDKRRAVEAALRLRPETSDRAIAEWCGVAPDTVNRIRRESLSESDSQLGIRTGRDGRTIDTTNIGKTPRQSAPAAGSSLFDEPNKRPSSPHPHSDLLVRWLDALTGQTNVIHVEMGGLSALLAEPSKWDWERTRSYVLPALESAKETIEFFIQEITNAAQR